MQNDKKFCCCKKVDRADLGGKVAATVRKWFCTEHCDQMVGLFFIIWPFATMKISPIMSQICQSGLSILPNTKKTFKNLQITCKLLQKWRNYSKSGHTGTEQVRRQETNGYTWLHVGWLADVQ